MRDHGVPAHSNISQRPVSPDYVFRHHRCQPCFLRVRVRVRVGVGVMVRVRGHSCAHSLGLEDTRVHIA